MFTRVQDKKELQGRSKEATATACLYIACRQYDVPRPFKEIVAVSTVSEKEIKECFKQILKLLDYISRFCSNLDISNKVQRS